MQRKFFDVFASAIGLVMVVALVVAGSPLDVGLQLRQLERAQPVGGAGHHLPDHSEFSHAEASHRDHPADAAVPSARTPGSPDYGCTGRSLRRPLHFVSPRRVVLRRLVRHASAPPLGPTRPTPRWLSEVYMLFLATTLPVLLLEAHVFSVIAIFALLLWLSPPSSRRCHRSSGGLRLLSRSPDSLEDVELHVRNEHYVFKSQEAIQEPARRGRAGDRLSGPQRTGRDLHRLGAADTSWVAPRRLPLRVRSRAPRARGPCRPPARGPRLDRPRLRRARRQPPGTGRVGPVSSALTPDIDTSRSQRPPDAIARRQASAAVRPVSGSATASAQNSGTPSAPDHQPARGRGVVTERDPVGRVARAPVAGDGDPDPGAAGAHQVGTVHPELRQRTRPARLDHHVGPSHQVVQDPDAVVALQVERDGSLAPVQQVEELAGPRRGTVGPLRRLDLDHRRAGAGQEVTAQRARPERREVDDDHSGDVGPGRCLTQGRPRHAGVPHRLADPGRREPEQLCPRQEIVADRRPAGSTRPPTTWPGPRPARRRARATPEPTPCPRRAAATRP